MKKLREMSGGLAAILATLAYGATGISGVLIVAEPSSLGLDGNELRVVAGWLALAASVVGVVVVALRRNLVPGVTTGIGNESPSQFGKGP